MKISLSLLFFCCSFLSTAQEVQPALRITPLTEDFYIFTTYRSYKGIPFPSNGMYVITNDGVILIDTPWDTTQFQPLLDSIKTRHNKHVTLCIATHSHEDRTGGLEYYRKNNIKTFTSYKTDSICIAKNEKRAEFLFRNDTTFTVGQYTFQTFYGGPGHTPDNIVIWFGQQKILYGGCLIKSKEAKDLGNLNDADINAWPETIRKVKSLSGKIKYIIPGHQAWDSRKALDHTMKLLKAHKKK